MHFFMIQYLPGSSEKRPLLVSAPYFDVWECYWSSPAELSPDKLPEIRKLSFSMNPRLCVWLREHLTDSFLARKGIRFLHDKYNGYGWSHTDPNFCPNTKALSRDKMKNCSYRSPVVMCFFILF